MKYLYDWIILIGRFQPFHNGHLGVLQDALKLGERVMVVLGSAKAPRTTKNPWTWLERAKMVEDSLGEEDRKRRRVIVTCASDCPGDDAAWKREIELTAQGIFAIYACEHSSRLNIAMIGHNKDASSFYLSMFPQWTQVKALTVTPDLDATPIRENYLAGGVLDISNLPPGTVNFLNEWRDTPDFAEVAAMMQQKEKAA